MKTRARIGLAMALLLTVLATGAFADYLIYNIDANHQTSSGYGAGPGSMPPGGAGPGPGAGAMAYPGAGGSGGAASAPRMILQGKLVVSGGVATFTHPGFKDSMSFSSQEFKNGGVDRKTAATPKEEYRRILGQAATEPAAVMQAGLWALKKGLLNEFYSAVDKVLELDSNHEGALRVKELKKQLEQALPPDPESANALKALVHKPSMKIESSNHFILLHDTESKAEKGHRKNRAHERLDLLEKAYATFMLLFQAQEVPLELPQERLKAVLFSQFQDFHECQGEFQPAFTGDSGFFDPVRNLSCFYDGGTTTVSKALDKQHANLQKDLSLPKNQRDPDKVRQGKVIDLLLEIESENCDVNAVSHVAALQMAGNTGLFPRHVEIPGWVQEGLAAYFEAPLDTVWAGAGAINEQRLANYKALKDDAVHVNVDFIVGDQFFDYARSQGAKPQHATAQAWALTHFLLEKHFKECVQFYRILGEMPPDVPLNPELLQELFARTLGSGSRALNDEWRSYMRTLKTDLERLEDAAPKRGK